MERTHASETIMFRVLSINGVSIVFEQHQNGRWKATATRGGESFELSRSISPEAMPFIVNALVVQPEEYYENEDFTQLSRKIKALIKQQYGILQKSGHRAKKHANGHGRGSGSGVS